MKILILFFTLFSLPAFAITPVPSGPIPTINFGSIVDGTVNVPSGIYADAVNSQGWFTLNPNTASLTVGNAWPLYKNGVKYQVPATFITTCYEVSILGGVGFGFQILSDTAPITDNMAIASLTAPKYLGGATIAYPLFAATASRRYGFTFDAASLTYLAMQAGSANLTYVLWTCREHK